MPGRRLANHRWPSVPGAGILANQRPPSFRHCVQPLLSVRNYNTSTKQNNSRETPCTRDEHARKTPLLGVRMSVLVKSARFIPCRADVFARGICRTVKTTLSPTAAKWMCPGWWQECQVKAVIKVSMSLFHGSRLHTHAVRLMIIQRLDPRCGARTVWLSLERPDLCPFLIDFFTLQFMIVHNKISLKALIWYSTICK